LDAAATKAAFDVLTAEVNAHNVSNGLPVKTLDEIAYGFIKVANEAMCRPIRALTQMKGFDITTHVLACFGGAGGQHACAIARTLGMRSIFIHKSVHALSRPPPWSFCLLFLVCS
jgi:5-oxoprolinase (ATP-hydrolysing)